MRANTQPKQSVLLANAKEEKIMSMSINETRLLETLNSIRLGAGVSITMKAKILTRRDIAVKLSSFLALNRIDSGMIMKQSSFSIGAHNSYASADAESEKPTGFVPSGLHPLVSINKDGRLALRVSANNLNTKASANYIGDMDGVVFRASGKPEFFSIYLDNIQSLKQGAVEYVAW